MMTRSSEGSKTHNELMNLSEEKLRNEGYTTSRLVRLPRGICDVYGEKNSEKVVVECFLRPSKRYLEEKKAKFSNYARLIFAVADSDSIKVKDAEVEVWRFPVHFGKTMSFSISNELEERFRHEVGRRRGYRKGAMGEAVAEALEVWLNKQALGSGEKT